MFEILEGCQFETIFEGNLKVRRLGTMTNLENCKLGSLKHASLELGILAAVIGFRAAVFAASVLGSRGPGPQGRKPLQALAGRSFLQGWWSLPRRGIEYVASAGQTKVQHGGWKQGGSRGGGQGGGQVDGFSMGFQLKLST